MIYIIVNVCLFIILNTIYLGYDPLKKEMFQEVRFEPGIFQLCF